MEQLLGVGVESMPEQRRRERLNIVRPRWQNQGQEQTAYAPPTPGRPQTHERLLLTGAEHAGLVEPFLPRKSHHRRSYRRQKNQACVLRMI